MDRRGILDRTDMRIAGCVIDDCRASDSEVGRRAGLSGRAAGARIAALRASGALGRPVMWVEPQVLGRGAFYVVAAGSDPAAFLARVRPAGDPFLVVPCVGGVTVCGVVPDGSAARGVEVARGLLRGMRVLSVFGPRDAPPGAPPVNRTDMRVLRALLDGPAAPVERLAARSGLSPKTVSRSLRGLAANPGVRFTSMYNPRRMDGYVPYAVLARGPPGALEGAAAPLAGSFLQRPFLSEGQAVLSVYGADIYEVDDAVQGIRAHPGVESADLFMPRGVEYPQEWLRAEAAAGAESGTLRLQR